jgi:hypothetical protein
MSQLQVTGEAKVRDIQGPVVANSGVITALDGDASQYVRGDGTLADFPTSTGGGSSVSYYLNSSVSQGTIGGVAYRQLGKTPIAGAGTDIAISSNGYVASYITDANDPALLEVPAGNFNCEFYFSVNSNAHNPYVYAELYKYDGTTFTLLGSNVAIPEYLTNGTTLSAYYFAVPVAVAALTVTDRISIRIYVNVDGRTVTLHTENGHLCQVVTTFSKGLISLNNLTRQNQFFGTGTSGTDFNISSATATHTFNLPVASATNTGKLSASDWTVFNNKQNTITDPITGTGASTQIAYFNSGTSITSEAAFNYDASLNRLGVNTSVPNATIGANAAIDSGYSLLLKSDNANYNGIGFGTDSTYGNLIATEKLGTAPARNLTLLNQSGYISLTEAGNLGVNILSPNTGVDIYNSTNAYLWLHTATSGITGTDGVRLALFSTNGANLRNFDGAFSITAEGDFSIITIGAENFRVNSSDGSIYQSKVANAMLKSVSGVITAAVANADYQSPITLTTSGSSGAATFSSNTLNIPNYTLSGLNGVPTSRTLTINGTAYDLSADRSWTVGTMGGSGTSGQVAYFNGTTSLTSEAGFIYDASTNRLGVNTSVPNATIGADSALDSGYGLLIKTGAANYNGIGIATDSTYGNLISTEKLGTASARNLTLLNQSGFVSLKENGSFGVNTLNPAVSGVGIDIYSSTSTGIRFHTATSGTTVSDGAGINFSAANNLGITNYENGAIDIVTNGNSGVYIASNGYVGINGATPSVALTVTGAGLFSTSLSVAGLTTGQILFPTSGGTLSGSSSLFWDNTNERLGIGTSTLGTRKVTIYSTNDAEHLHLIANAPALQFGNALTATYGATVGLATAPNNFITGAIAGDLCITTNSANSIYFGNGNTATQRMRLTSAGDLGIGASTPDTKLDVRGEISLSYSASNGLRFYNQDRSNWSSIGNDTATGSSNANLVFRTSAGTALTIAANRNTTFATAATFSSSVSIGGANQDYQLDVKRTSTGDSTFDSIANFYKASTNATQLLIRAKNGLIDLAGSYIVGGGGPQTALSFSVSPSGGSPTEAMRITSGGNVGIGTSSPDKALVVGGVSTLTATSTPTAIALDNSYFNNSTQTGDALKLYILRGGVNIGLGAGNIGDFNIWCDGLTRFYNGGNERMRIRSGGSVGIGTVGQDSVKLEVKGGGTGSTNYAVLFTDSSANDLFYARTDGLISTGLKSLSPTNNTTGAAANVWINTIDGTLGRSTSSIKYKKNVQDYTKGLAEVMQLRPVSYNGKSQIDEGKTFAGLIAEEVHELGLMEFVQYAEDGTPDALAYTHMMAIVIKAIQELKQEIDILKNK